MGEVLVVEGRETLAVVDGLANDEHRGKGEMVVVDNLGQVFELTAIDALVGPGEMITGGNGGVLWVLLKQFSLHIVDNRCGEENAHRRLATGQQMQLFFLGHRRTAFTTRQDNRLASLRDGELAL